MCHGAQYNESLHKNFALRAQIDELRQDKMGMIRRIEAIQDKIDSSSEAIVQLINIANVYYTKRSHTRLVYSELVTQAVISAFEHGQSPSISRNLGPRLGNDAP
jgi:hypothetical protein